MPMKRTHCETQQNMCGKNKGMVALVPKAVENDGGSKLLKKFRLQKMFGYVCSKTSHIDFIRFTGMDH